MSLLLHILGKVMTFTIVGVIVLTVLRLITKSSSGPVAPDASTEWPGHRATRIDRISDDRPYSSSRRDLQAEQERRRA